jgi:predicted transcriptional regulator
MENNKIVTELISDRLTELVEELSTNEFREQVGDTIFERTGKNLDEDELNDVIFNSIQPLLLKVVEYVTHSSFHQPQ